ncbi:UNKNOWN [Stylonychia lemnae]|uniref:Uncharacterized protein n=1 Tax=Stylonychia lemnae TaxID=5949 RepID=A0A078AYX6_STYLE|nr:UNKNOWN [Stylonychia lemnae]|eukprot:CDW87336.1 UNKNOWN [Stylonychia lemnae]
MQQTLAAPPMVLQEERHTKEAISYKVKLPPTNISPTQKELEVKKRLELSAKKAAQGPMITIEEISMKLKRAEEKRKISLTNQISPKTEERRLSAWENKKYYEKQQLEHFKDKFEKVLPSAEEKRRATRESKRQKLRQHIKKVEEIRREQASKRQETSELMKTELDHKLQHADQIHQQTLENKINKAQYSAEKKKKSGGMFTQEGGQSQVSHDDIPLPHRHEDLNQKLQQYK